MAEIQIRGFKKEDIFQLNRLRTQRYICENTLSMPVESEEETALYFEKNKGSQFVYIAENMETKQLVGYIVLRIDTQIRRRHKGNVSIVVDPDYHREEIGGLLMDQVIHLAFRWLLLEKIELSVLTENQQAVSLYKKKGFCIEGHLMKDTIVCGELKDVYTMALFKG